MIYTTIEDTIPAGGFRVFPVSGRYLRLMENSGEVDISVGWNSQVYEKLEGVTAGVAAKLRDVPGRKDFTHVRVAGAAGVTFKIIVTDGEVLFDKVSVTVAARAHACTSGTAGAASAEVLAANASRTYLQVQNQSTTEDAYITSDGDAAAVNGTSLKLGPGDVWAPLVPPTGAIKAIRGAAADVTLNIIEAS